jgi:Subtilase family
MPFTTALAAAVAGLGVLAPLPALGATAGAGGASVRSQEWWLAGLHVTQAWRTSVGTGVTVAVLDTGVDPDDADLAGDVTTGPDFTGSGRTPGSPYWGFNGTSVAGIIAGHGHGTGDRSGIVGIAPGARILSVRVTLEFNDPLSSGATLSRRLPGAIADGIAYAVAHGARVIDLPLDPGTLGITGQGDPAAAGGSAAELAAVENALGKSVVLVAPAGDDGMGPGIVNYPAAYPGVIAVGAVGRGGQLASFSSRRSYVSLTAPGVGLEVAVPPDDYQALSSTSAASGMVAGVAALIVSRFPRLTAAQVTRALTESTAGVTGATSLPPLPARSTSGAGYGTVDAARAIQMAALITAASQPPVQPVRPRKQPARRPVAVPSRAGSSALAGSVLRAALAGVCVLIVLLVVMLLVMRSRRGRGRATAARADRAPRARARGLHEQRGPDRVPAPPVIDQDHGARARPPATRPGPPAVNPWPSPGGWQGGGIGAIAPEPAPADPPFRPAMTSAPRAATGHRSGRGAGADGTPGGPPWAPAPEPGRTLGPLPVASPGSPPPEPGPGIRVPGDMAVPTAVGESTLSPALGDLDTATPPAGFAMTPPLSDFGPPPAAFDSDPPPTAVSNLGPPAATELPGRENLGFAAAPVADDYVAPFTFAPGPAAQEDSAPAPGPAADPSFIWDLAATDVFPAATGGDPPTASGPPAEQAGGPEPDVPD